MSVELERLGNYKLGFVLISWIIFKMDLKTTTCKSANNNKAEHITKFRNDN